MTLVNHCVTECVKVELNEKYSKFRCTRLADVRRHFYDKLHHSFVGVVVITAATCSVFVALKECGEGKAVCRQEQVFC
jgi:hypothetical protein